MTADSLVTHGQEGSSAANTVVASLLRGPPAPVYPQETCQACILPL